MFVRVVVSALSLFLVSGQTIDDLVCPPDVTGWVRLPSPSGGFSSCVVGLCDPHDPNSPSGRQAVIECDNQHQVIQEILNSPDPIIPTACGYWSLAAHCVQHVCQAMASPTGCGDTIPDEKGPPPFPPQSDVGGGDPHEVQTVLNTPLCYNIIGNDGDTYRLLEDANTNSVVETTISGTGPYYYSAMTIRTPTKDITFLAGKPLTYNEVTKSGGTGETVVTEWPGGSVRVDVDLEYTVIVTCRKNHLYFSITSIESLSGPLGGIMGAIRNTVAKIDDGPTTDTKIVFLKDGDKAVVSQTTRLQTLCYKVGQKKLVRFIGPLGGFLV